MLKRLRIRFVCITMVIVTGMLGVIFGLVLHFTQRDLEQQSVTMMRAISEAPNGFGRPDEELMEIRLPFFTLELEEDGNVTTLGGSDYDLSDEAFLQEIMRDALSSAKQTGIIAPYHLRFLRVGAPDTQQVLFVDASYERGTMERLVRNCAVIGVVSILVFLVVSLLLAAWAVRPVEQAWTQQRQFVADASHELKTPLTVVITNAELLGSPNFNEGEKSRFAYNILTEAGQMRGLVEGLLELARVDDGSLRLRFSKVEFSQLVQDALLPFEPVFFEQGLFLHSEVETGITLKGSEAHLKQAVSILLDNAQKYSTPSGKTTVILKKVTRNRCLLSVANEGEEIAPEELKHIFKRFYRVDKSRSTTHGYGLGLSIAQRIVHTHHGKIWAESRNGVNTFFVQLSICVS
jgi:signal transduction histidine kinase